MMWGRNKHWHFVVC